MVERDLRGRGVKDERVLAAMERVPRHRFVPPELRAHAYEDRALPIGHGQTISQPYIVALMTELLELRGGEKVLEVGTGSGYQAAVLAELGCEVYTVELVEPLGKAAKHRLEELGYDRVHVRIGDAYHGWPEAAPFDAAIFTAATPRVPEPILEQLSEGARIVAPLDEGAGYQTLVVGRKEGGRVSWSPVAGVAFVPMRGLVRTPEEN